MAFILTFLGKGGTGRTTLAIAAAKRYAQQGKRVLLASQSAGPGLGLMLNRELGVDPQEVEPNFHAVQFRSATLLERSWEEVKKLEAQYVKTPFFKEVYGQELGVLPGMDSALALNALREYDASNRYDVIVYDGAGDQATLRMLGMPEILSWYVRRFRKVFTESDFWKSLSPFIQPVSSAVLNVNWSGNDIFNQQPANEMNNILDEGKAAVTDPNRVAAYLVTTDDPVAIATAAYLWGSAQQVGLTVGGVLLNQANTAAIDSTSFAPLPLSAIPTQSNADWQPLVQALPDFSQAVQAPKSVTIDTANKQVRLFLPNFDKRQVKLTQYGPEVTIEAGDQRRNLWLPPALSGRQVTGAKFQDGYLIISF